MRRKLSRQNPAAVINNKAAQQLQIALNLTRNNQIQSANAIFQQLLEDYPKEPAIHFHYGNLLWSLKQPQVAAKHYSIAVEYRSDFIDALGNLGAALAVLGKQQEAISCYKKVIKLDPGNASFYHNLGGAYYQQGKASKAVSAFRKAIKINPSYADAYKNLGNAYYEQGYYSEAVDCYKKVTKLSPSDGAKVRLVSAIPMIPMSTDHINEIRSRLLKNMDNLLSQKLKINDPVIENGYTNFFLAYHGLDNRQIHEKYAQLYRQACPSLVYTAEHCREYEAPASQKIKVGFISKFFTGHSIGNTSRGLIAELSRDKFHVTAIFLDSIESHVGKIISESADQVVTIPSNLDVARKLIGDLKLDVLFYQDIGMEPFTYFLAYARLAPVQCVSFGHPDTTGITSMDYFISTEFYETDGGDKHYSELLYRLKNVSSCAYYYKPRLPSPLKPRSAFGLDDETHIYICPQTLFKFHPDFDSILAGILRADPDGQVVLIEGKHAHWAEILRERFNKSMPDVMNRVRVRSLSKRR